MPLHTPLLQQARVVNQLSTPPSTKKKAAIKEIKSRESKVKDPSQQLAATQCKLPDVTTRDTAGFMTSGKQAHSRGPMEMAETNDYFKLSELTMSKLAAFRYQAKPSENDRPGSFQNNPGSHIQDLNHFSSSVLSDATAARWPVIDADPAFQGFCVAANSVEDPDEHLQTQQAQSVGFEETPYTDANAGPEKPDIAKSTDKSTQNHSSGLDFGFGGVQGCSHLADSDLNPVQSATNEHLLRHAPAFRSSGTFGGAESDDDHSNLTKIGYNVTDNDDEDLLALYTHHDNAEEIARDCQAEAANSFHPTASFHDQDHMADFVWEPQVESEQESEISGDEFPMDPDDISDMLHLPAAQGTLEPCSSLQLPFSHENHAVEVKSPHHMESSRPSSGRSVYSILKKGVYVPVDATTTMGALNSDTGASGPSLRFSPDTRSQAPPTDNLNTVPSSTDDEERFHLDEEDEIEFADLTASVSEDYEEIVRDTYAKSYASPKTRQVRPHTVNPTSPILISSSSPQELPNLDPDRALGPFVRHPFPKPVRDRSPILGLSSSGVLRTCFRIGEALNAASIAFRTGTDVIIELYARVMSSSREQKGWKQHFQFADLFHSERPPFLNGTYELWKDADLWEKDSGKFLGEDGSGRMCRAVGRMKREEPSKVWKMAILNIWEASWDDVAWVKGIVCA